MSAAPVMVRKAEQADIPAMVAILETKRVEYQGYEPVFWNKAANSAEIQTGFFTYLLEQQDRTTMFAAELGGTLKGFLIATLTPAPPIVDPGGPTATIDDFHVAHPELWESVGEALIEHAMAHGREQGWRQIIVVCPHRERAKAGFLADKDLSLTTEWWTKTL
ncbi:MAG: GNAT family N-acetyltransferase [Candidatus Andeanibacterium colombiense]|uniref:GNAT family N-acetyltransferase n=1 Tax=Candidatus Andeanibacterium colombiense TaxID=3121345 RepID=A0AAJ5X6E6_9SPHN|nr:MAG: GNAT family N-acetyltransferase [Sphingomonadaceae bacterium]